MKNAVRPDDNLDPFSDFTPPNSPFASLNLRNQISPSRQLEKNPLVSQQQKHNKKQQKHKKTASAQCFNMQKSETPNNVAIIFFGGAVCLISFRFPPFSKPPSNARRLREPAADFGKAPPGTDDLGVGLDHGSGGCASVMAYENQWVSLNKAENGTLVYVRVVY